MTTSDRLRKILVDDYSFPAERVTPAVRLEELGIDSLGLMELLFKVEDEFKIRIPSEQVPLETVEDVVRYIDRLTGEQHAAGAPAATAS
jgi:acyl carrier protein